MSEALVAKLVAAERELDELREAAQDYLTSHDWPCPERARLEALVSVNGWRLLAK